MDIKGYIYLNKHGIWQMQYEFIQNGVVKKKQVSTKVKIEEHDRDYMLKKYLPAKLALIKEQLQGSGKAPKPKALMHYYQEFLDMHTEYDTWKRLKQRGDKVVAFFGNTRDIDTITTGEIEKYLMGLKLDKNTVQGYFRVLKGIYERAIKAEVTARNPCLNVKLTIKKVKNKDDVGPFEPPEVQKLIKHAEADLKNYLGIAFNTGMSPEEIIALMPQDIDNEKNLIRISRVITKNEQKEQCKTKYRERKIPLFASAKPYIMAQMELAKSRRSLFLFCKENGERLNDIEDLRGQRKNNTKWYKLIRDCNIVHRHLKNCRHTWAVQAIKSGKLTLQQIADTWDMETLGC